MLRIPRDSYFSFSYQVAFIFLSSPLSLFLPPPFLSRDCTKMEWWELRRDWDWYASPSYAIRVASPVHRGFRNGDHKNAKCGRQVFCFLFGDQHVIHKSRTQHVHNTCFVSSEWGSTHGRLVQFLMTRSWYLNTHCLHSSALNKCLFLRGRRADKCVKYQCSMY